MPVTWCWYDRRHTRASKMELSAAASDMYLCHVIECDCECGQRRIDDVSIGKHPNTRVRVHWHWLDMHWYQVGIYTRALIHGCTRNTRHEHVHLVLYYYAWMRSLSAVVTFLCHRQRLHHTTYKYVYQVELDGRWQTRFRLCSISIPFFPTFKRQEENDDDKGITTLAYWAVRSF